MALPTASTPGYTYFTDIYGKKWVACVCLAKWLGVYQRLLLAKKLIKSGIDPWQLTGGATASGGTHSQGGAFDLLYQTTAAHVAVAREMGAPATWSRTVAQGFSKPHLHGVLSGCPHNGPARYQITAQARGYNGLGKATSGTYAGMYGYGAKDNHPDPLTYRTWEQGIAWAEAEIKRLTPAPPVVAPAPVTPTPTPTTPPKVNPPMTLTAADISKIWHSDGYIKAPGSPVDGNTHWAPGTYLYSTKADTVALRAEVAELKATLDKILAALNKPTA